MFPSRFMPCSECGASVERVEADRHTCDPTRLMDYRLFTMSEEIAAFEQRFHQFVRTDAGRFESWLAARTVRGA